MSELKPCPFCGWEFAEHAWNEFGEEYRVCDQCGASSGTVDSKWDWQSRPIEDKLRKRIAELKELTEGRDPFEDFPPKERGFDCSVLVLGRFEWEEEYQPMSNWDLCRYLFDEQKWFAINGYLCEDDIVAWYPLPEGA